MGRSYSEFDDDAGGAEPPAPSGRRPEAKAHTTKNYPALDMHNPAQFHAVVLNHVNMRDLATPKEVTEGREWYPKVHDAVTKGVKGTSLSHFQGSGLVAAISPNMDWEHTNIPAFGELNKLHSSDWDEIHRSANQPRQKVYDEDEGKWKSKAAPRTGAASSILQGMSLSQVPDSNLVKAHRILQGEDPEDVLPRRTAPKTNSFAWDIHDPSGESHPRDRAYGRRGPFITVDGRHHDISGNAMYPWTFSGRGISSAHLSTSEDSPTTKAGKPSKRWGQLTRYEHIEDATHAAAEATDEHPINLQAINWTVGKRIERQGLTASGEERQKGVERTGQAYLPGSPQPARSRSQAFAEGAR